MYSQRSEIDDTQDLSAREDPSHSIISACLERAMRTEKELLELNREIAVWIITKEKIPKRATLARIKQQ